MRVEIHDHNNVTDLLDRFERLERLEIEVGILQEGKGGDGHSKGEPITILEIANIHEFGAPSVNIPERSFIRKTFDKDINSIVKQSESLILDYIEGNITFNAMANAIGEDIVGKVQETIRNMTSPSLKASTIKAKGGKSGLLRDTGRLIGSIEYKIRE